MSRLAVKFNGDDAIALAMRSATSQARFVGEVPLRECTLFVREARVEVRGCGGETAAVGRGGPDGQGG